MAAMTLEQFLLQGDTEPSSEFACGEVNQKPMPDWNHSTIQAYLVGLLLQFLARERIGRVLPEFRCIFGPLGRERAFVPDLVFIARRQLPVDRYLRAAPDLAVEILSPGQNVAEFLAKITFYLRYGVRVVWVIDAEESTVTVFSPDTDEVRLRVGETLDGGSVLPGFSVAVADIFEQTQD